MGGVEPRPTEGNGKLGKRAVGDAGPYAPYETSIGRDDVGIVPYGCVAGSAVRWVTARVAPTEGLQEVR